MIDIEQLATRLLNYCNDICEGRILACKKHINAVKRFLRDLEKSQDEDYPYEFDLEELYKFYEWALLFKHTKGVLAGKPIELTDFQLFLIGNIFCWKDKQTGYRRFRKVYIQLARKNAKSQLLALMASYDCFLSREVAEVYISGWNKDTSNIVYDEIKKQIDACDFLQGKYSDSYHKITHLKSGSTIKSLSRESKRFGDGFNASLGIVDEYHTHLDSSIYDVISSSQVARKEPLMVIITTAGFNLMGYPCYTEYQYVSKLLDEHNPTENDTYFALVCELDEEDDIKNPEVWIKANPIVCTYPEGIKSLEEDLKLALDVPEKMRNYLTKNMNLWCLYKKSGYLPLDKWKLCEDSFTLEDMRGLPCLVGVDLSAKIDLTSLSFLFVKDGFLYVHSHSFMPEDTLEAKRKTDKVDYWLWMEQGYITMTPGSVVDYEFLEKYLDDIKEKYELNILEVCADPWNATQFLQNLEQKGYLPVEIRQGIQSLGFPTKDFRDRVYAGKVKHDGNPVLTWAIGNAVTKQDANENIMLSKERSSERIDPIASVINAHVRIVVLEGGENSLDNHILSDDWSF